MTSESFFEMTFSQCTLRDCESEFDLWYESTFDSGLFDICWSPEDGTEAAECIKKMYETYEGRLRDETPNFNFIQQGIAKLIKIIGNIDGGIYQYH